MEVFVVSFVLFALACLALGLGQLFGREPIKGTCRPGDGTACANEEICALRRASGKCRKRSA